MFGRFFDRFTWRGKTLIAVVAVVLVLGLGVMIGSRARRGGGGAAVGAGASPSATPAAVASGLPTVAQGDSGDVLSSTGVDYGAGLERLEGSAFARTSDPAVFAASVRAGMGYDYSGYQPADVAAEADRVNQEILAGMSPSTGPLGAQVHDALRSAVTRSTDLDQLTYRIQARQRDSIDVTAVTTLDNEVLHRDVGDSVYLSVIQHRQEGVYQLAVTAAVTTTVEAVGDTAGWTRTQTTATHMLVWCPDGGLCSLIGLVGSEDL